MRTVIAALTLVALCVPAKADPYCLGVEVMVLGVRACIGERQAARTVTITVCPNVRERTKDFQAKAAAELDHLAPGSALEGVVAEWISLRDQARRCREMTAKGRAGKK